MDTGFKFYAFLFVGVYLVALILTGLWYGRREDAGDFIIGNRNIGVLPTAASLAASFRDGGGLVFWITSGFVASYAGLWLFVGVAISVLILSIIGPKLRTEAGTDGHITIQERVDTYIGTYSSKLTAVVSLIFGGLIIALQYHVSGTIFAEILGVPKVAGVAIVGAIIAAYMVTGGYKSVIVTDTIQFFIMFSLVAVPFLVPPVVSDVTNFKSFLEGDFQTSLALMLFGIYYLLIAPECWQRIFSAKNERVVRIGLPLTLLMLVLMTFSLLWLGMGLRQVYPDIDKLTLYAKMFQDNALISPWVLGYILLVFLSITMSTQSAACYGCVSTFGKIFMPALSHEPKCYIAFTRIGIVVVLCISAVMSLTVSKAIEYMFDIVGFMTCLAPTYVLAALAPRLGFADKIRSMDKSVAMATLAGIVLFFAFVGFGVTDRGFLYSVIPGLVTTVAVAGVVLMRFRRN